MKTVQELYKEIMASEDLKKGFVEAAKDGKQMDFIKEHGCEASAEEIEAFLQGQSEEERALSADELEDVAGGGCNTATAWERLLSIASIGIGCVVKAIESASEDKAYTGQKDDVDGRLCNSAVKMT